MPSLYDLADDMLKLEAMMAEAEGDEGMLEALNEALDDQTKSFESKANGMFALMRNWAGFAESLKAEEGKLAAKRQVLDNRIKYMKGYLLAHMQRTKKAKVEVPLGTFSITSGRESVVVDDDLVLPQGYYETVASVKPDKAALKKLWADTPEAERNTLLGFHVERGDDSLKIK
jgi:hypothetical protein